MPKLRMYMLAICVLAVPGAAVADTVIETFTFPTLTGYTSESGTDLTLFNPALGTLTSARLDLNATSIWSGGADTAVNRARYQIEIDSIVSEDLGTVGVGNSIQSDSRSFVVPSGDLSSLIGPGTASTSVNVLNLGGTPTSIRTTFAPESITYTYTPVPEPEMLPVLGGILAVGVFWRRRNRAVS